MGIIQRQSIKQTIVNYVATGIGALSTLFVYPLAESMYGLALFLTGTASFIFPLASLGITSLTIRFFPNYEDSSNRHHGFLSFLLLAIGLSFSIFLVAIWLLAPPLLHLLDLLSFNVSLFQELSGPIIVLSLILALNVLFTNYISNFGKIVVPAVFNNLWTKIALPALILLVAFNTIDQTLFVRGVILYHVVALIVLIIYLRFGLEEKLGKPHQQFFSRPVFRRMGEYSLYGMLGSLGSILAFRIDYIMVAAMTTLSSTGVYGIAQFIGNSIEMPTRSVYSVAGPVIAKAWKSGDMTEIASIYKKASINLLFVGLFIFLVIWPSLDDLFRLTTKYEILVEAKNVVLFVSIAKLFDMTTSVNSEIIGYSRYFRFNLYATLILGATNLLLNYLLIPRMGINGAALATMLSIMLFNFAKVVFIWNRIKIHPFSINTIKMTGLAIITLGLMNLFPNLPHPLLNILKNGVLASIFFFLPGIGLKLAPDIHKVVLDTWHKLFG